MLYVDSYALSTRLISSMPRNCSSVQSDYQVPEPTVFRDAAGLLERADDLSSFRTALHVNRRLWKSSLAVSRDRPRMEWLSAEAHWVGQLFSSGRTPNDQEVLSLIKLDHQVAGRLERAPAV